LIGLSEMKANNPKVLIPVALAIVALILLATVFTGGKSYSTNLDDLRKQFNSDTGKVRLLMLLSPT
jgi:hypothetical protein